MPIYVYRCSFCASTKEILQKISDPALTLCSVCHKETMVKQVTAAGFQLTGSGWYATDFRNSANKPSEKTSAEDNKVSGETNSANKEDKDNAKNKEISSHTVDNKIEKKNSTPVLDNKATNTSSSSQ